jgi:glycosyltransferase involved in cell wall biosynthesis
MRVSVVVPTLNEGEYIGKCIKSILTQSHPADEIIVVDSGSVDGTVDVARNLGVVVVRGEKSIPVNRQLGVEAGTGDVVVTTDADCVHPRDWLERIVGHFNDRDVVFVTGVTKPMPGESIFLDRACYFIGNLFMLFFHLFGEEWSRGSNSAYRRDVMLDVGGYNTELVAREDSDLSKRMKGRGMIVFDWSIKVYTSMRRRESMGWLRTLRYYVDTPIHFLTNRTYYRRVDDGVQEGIQQEGL